MHSQTILDIASRAEILTVSTVLLLQLVIVGQIAAQQLPVPGEVVRQSA